MKRLREIMREGEGQSQKPWVRRGCDVARVGFLLETDTQKMSNPN